MLDFGALPPEVNSARMYAGPGSGPMVAAASAWDELAAQLESYAGACSRTLSELQGQTWSGAASTAMAGASAPYVAWATTAAAQAEQTAAHARAAAAAHEAAFAATVPPHVVSANRIQLAALVATNFLGLNAPAIAATEAQYGEMWAQDATAMYGYAGSSSAATALTPFARPPQTTNAGGQSDQAAAVTRAADTATGDTHATASRLLSALPQHLQTLATGSSGSPASTGSTSSPSLLTLVSDFNTAVTTPGQTFTAAIRTVSSAGLFGTGLNLAGIQAAKAATKAAASAADVLTPATVPGPVLAGMGQAAPVGELSVPKTWLAGNPISGGPISLSGSEFRATPAAVANPPANGLGALPPVRAANRSAGVPVLRNGRRVFTMPRPASGG